MRLHELVADRDVIVVHKDGYTRALTPVGAVYDTPDTEDLLNMSVACGILLHDSWRLATDDEVEAFNTYMPDRIIQLAWSSIRPKPRPKLTLVHG